MQKYVELHQFLFEIIENRDMLGLMKKCHKMTIE